MLEWERNPHTCGNVTYSQLDVTAQDGYPLLAGLFLCSMLQAGLFPGQSPSHLRRRCAPYPQVRPVADFIRVCAQITLRTVDYSLIWKHFLNSRVTHYCGAPTVQVRDLLQCLLTRCLTYNDKDWNYEPSQCQATSASDQDDHRGRRTHRSFARPARIQRVPIRSRLRPDVRACLFPLLLESYHSKRTTARLMGPSRATTHSLRGLRFPSRSGPNLSLDRDTPSPPHSRSASFATQPLVRAKSSWMSPATAKRSARSSCAETSSCRATFETPTRPLARSTAVNSTLAISPSGTQTGPCRFKTGRKTLSFQVERYVRATLLFIFYFIFF